MHRPRCVGTIPSLILGLENGPNVVDNWILWTIVAVLATASFAATGVLLRNRKMSMSRASAGSVVESVVTMASRPERRESPRRLGNIVPALIADFSTPDRTEAVLIVERSDGGMRIVVDGPRELGDILTIRATSAPAETPWTKIAVRNRNQASDRWEMGCQFLEPVPWNIRVLFG